LHGSGHPMDMVFFAAAIVGGVGLMAAFVLALLLNR
jgi:hypothetical protein